jgi:hypothetical protein
MFAVTVIFNDDTQRVVYNVDRILNGDAYFDTTVLLWTFSANAPIRFDNVANLIVAM